MTNYNEKLENVLKWKPCCFEGNGAQRSLKNVDEIKEALKRGLHFLKKCPSYAN